MSSCPRCGADQEVAAAARWAVCTRCGHLWKPDAHEDQSASYNGDDNLPEAIDIRPITVIDPDALRQDSDEVSDFAESDVADPDDVDPVIEEDDLDDSPFPMESSEYHPDAEAPLAGLDALTVRRNGRPLPSALSESSSRSVPSETSDADSVAPSQRPCPDADLDLFDRIERDIAFERSEHQTMADSDFVSDQASPTRALHCPMCGTEVQVSGNTGEVRCPQCDTAIEIATGRVSDDNDDDDDDESDQTSEGEDVLINCTVSGCVIDRKLGEGGMGAVYHARQVSLDRSVAIKVLPPSLKRNRKFIRRFEQEAKAMARINHPNIMHIYDFGEDAGTQAYYMVMEYVDGQDLAEVLQIRRRLPADEVLDVILQCARGLSMSAEKQVVHRDIKPDNLMITRQGVIKISDFGLAKDIAADLEVTNAGMRVGTPAFMSPEQCDGKKLDFRSDIYSLGCTAYVAATGHLPFNGDSPFSIMLKHKSAPYPGLAKYLKEVDPAMDSLIERMMAKEPNDRYNTLDDLITAVESMVPDRRGRPRDNSSSSQRGPAWRQPSTPVGELPPLPFDMVAIQPSEATAPPSLPAPSPVSPGLSSSPLSASENNVAQRPTSSIVGVSSPVPLGGGQDSSDERPSSLPSAHASQGVRSRPLGSSISSRQQVATEHSASSSTSAALPTADSDASRTAQLIARAEDAMRRDEYASAMSLYQDVVQRRPGERRLHACLAEARAAARQQEVGNIEAEGDRLAHAGKLRAAIGAWQRAAQMHSEWRYRENVLQKVDRAYGVLSRYRRRRIMLAAVLLICILVGALFYFVPVVHQHMAAQAWDELQQSPEGYVEEDDILLFLESYGSVPHWYGTFFSAAYVVPAAVEARTYLQEIVEQREQERLQQRQQQAYQRLLIMAEDEDVSWVALANEVASVRDHFHWQEEQKVQLHAIMTHAEEQVETLREGVATIDKLLLQGHMADALALASRLRQLGRLGFFAGSLPHPVTISVVDSQGAALASTTVTIVDEQRSSAAPLEDPGLGYRLRDRSLMLRVDVPGFIRMQQALPSMNDDDASTIIVTMRPGRAWVSTDFAPVGTAPWTRFITLDSERSLLHGGQAFIMFRPTDGTILATARRNDYQPQVSGGLDSWSMAMQALDGGWVVAGQDGRVIELVARTHDQNRLTEHRALASLRQPVVALALFEPLNRLGREYLVSIQQAARHYWMQTVDITSGEVRWQIDEFSAGSVPYLLRRRDKLFVIGHEKIRGIDEESGREMPALELVGARSGQPAWLDDGRAIIPVGKHLELIAFPQQVEMRRDATAELPASILASPVTSGDRVAVVLADGSVMVLSVGQQVITPLLQIAPEDARRFSGVMAMDSRRLALADNTGRMTIYDHRDAGSVLRTFDHPAAVVVVHFVEDMLLVYDDREQVSGYFARP